MKDPQEEMKIRLKKVSMGKSLVPSVILEGKNRFQEGNNLLIIYIN